MLAAIDRLITPGRARALAVVLALVYGAATLIWLMTLKGGMDVFHQPLGGDFIIFYGASSLTLHGHAAAAFDPHVLLLAERAAVAGVQPGLEWCYPPTYQLLLAPLALVPFPLAYALFLAVTGAVYLLMIRKISTHRSALLMACVFPGAVVDAWQGQNGLLTAGLLGLGLMSVERRPWLGGAILGLLVYKPQFGVLLPLLLIGTGRWKSVLAAAASGGLFIAASVAAFGIEPWRAFFQNLPSVSASLGAGLLPWAKVPSVFVALLWLGVPKTLAYAVQVAFGLAIAALTVAAWRRPGPHALKVGLAALATLLISPYSFNYDLVLLAIPIAAVAEHARTHVLPTGTKTAMLLAVFTPNLFLGLADAIHLQLMPLAILITYAAVWRALRAAAPESSAQSPDFSARPLTTAALP